MRVDRNMRPIKQKLENFEIYSISGGEEEGASKSPFTEKKIFGF